MAVRYVQLRQELVGETIPAWPADRPRDQRSPQLNLNKIKQKQWNADTRYLQGLSGRSESGNKIL